ncbi:TetR/AcrR family transcriptional regulator [Streptomyces sp. MST-110588]|uniref:TetR/AcrR family transcriptional regulator n=1 Tax=Streptomyces sp. MST-110588 TaxID=2833628 RepID=UPI001F5CD790|nr:TetR/AcrR family transcriptional regulator [Streptomyces sp. MST-110588]UNO40843.1 TetR/AcrR family transcriptional regulator C-terminal domain-containing protein [Streptomyces sp. MST-110588]
MAATDSRAGKQLKSVWLAERPPLKRKADQPAGLDLDKVVAATVRLLDAEGLAKFSMRRLAAELGVTAMSVYWYVDTKDALLELAIDAVTGEMTLPDEADEGADWRDHLRQLAGEYRRMLLAHPWVARLLGEYLNIGPRSIAFNNVTLRAMQRSGLPQEKISGALAAVFQFVYGFSAVEALHEARCREVGISLDDYLEQVMGTIRSLPEFAETWQMSSKALDADRGLSAKELSERDFAFALDLQIAGIEALRDAGRTVA